MIIALTLAIAATAVTIIFPDIGTKAVKEALVLVSTSVLPSMFCFMVLSRFIQKTNGARILMPLIKPVARILKLNEEELSCFVSGNLCGYPNGAISASEVIKKIPGEDYTLAAVSNNVSIGFTVALCGKIYLNSTLIGVIIFISQLASAVMIGFILRRHRANEITNHCFSVPNVSMCFCESIKESAYSSLVLSGFIVFFHVISAYIKELMILLDAPRLITVITTSLLEISSGCKEAASLGDVSAVALISFLCGFSGLCVIFQSSVYLIPSGINIKKYILFKVFQGVCTASITVPVYLLVGCVRYE